MGWLLPDPKQNNVTIILIRLVLDASMYFVWQECNHRIHGSGIRIPDQVAKIIFDMVRLKLASIPFKRKPKVDQMRRTWRLTSLLIDGG